MKRTFIAIALLSVLAATLSNADPVLTPSIGANSISYTHSIPSDFELGGSASASLSPHISAVGGAWYGLGHTYLRGTIGARVTATDVDDPNFSVGLGAQYNASSKPEIRPQGWDVDATLGWRPYPERLPQVVLIAQGAYMLAESHSESEGAFNATYLVLGVRYILKPF